MSLWYGILIGTAAGFLRWRVPTLYRVRKVRNLRLAVKDVRRMRGQFQPGKHVANSSLLRTSSYGAVRQSWREWIEDRWIILWEFHRPLRR